MKQFPAKTVSLLACTALLLLSIASPASAASTINGHTVVTDSGGKIVSWLPNQNLAYDAVTALAWNYLLGKVPDDPQTGKPAYLSQSYLSPDAQEMAGWPNNPAGMHAMLIESAIEYYKYSGNSAVLGLAKAMANQHLTDGMTLASDDWANVPYASGDAGSLVYHGAGFGNSSGIGDGAGYLEPDKVAELGYALLQLYECTGDTAYRDAAINSAKALAAHVTTGNSTQSPWPFRVSAKSGAIREQYGSHVISAIELFDELDRLGLSNTEYRSARGVAWTWMMAYPMKNNAWAGYFEDIVIQSDASNTNQLDPMMVARYLLRHPDTDPDWLTHVRGLISWVESTFGVTEYGAMTIKEQQLFMHAMGSHTSRYASVNALLYEKTGDLAAREKAYRAFNWATYMARANGVVIDGPTVNNQWFTDGYGDFIRHFLVGMFSVPQWAPTGQTHLLESSSVITDVVYGAGQVTYTTFDTAGTETIKTAAAPTSVKVDGKTLALRSDLQAEGWTYDPSQGLVTVRHDSRGTITVGMTGTPTNLPPAVSLTAPTSGGSYTAPADFAVTASAADADGTVSRVEFYQDGKLLGQDTTAPYQFDVSGLAAGSYTYVAKAFDNQDGTASSAPVTVTVTAPGDTTPPGISGVTVSDVNQNGATVSWTTSEPADSQIDYGPTASYGSRTALNTNLDTAHTQVVAGLAAGTTYHYRVRSTDAAGNLGTSPDLTFATPASADSQPPEAPTNLTAVIGTDGNVHLSWSASTDNVGVNGYQVIRNDKQLASSSTTSYVDSTAPADSTNTYAVVAIDAAGNVSAPSDTVNVTTPGPIAPSLAVDTQVAAHASSISTRITSPKLSTSDTDELLVAFIASDGPTTRTSRFASVTGGGLTWTLRKRVNDQAGTSEIWTAAARSKLTDITVTATRRSGSYRNSLVVTAFSGADLSTPGATGGGSAENGAPGASLTTTRADSWVWGVGNDWDTAEARVMDVGQVLVDQFLTPENDTLWVQRRSAATPVQGTEVTIAATAPTKDRWNLALLEIIPAN
jgi:fibronectin type 3 domain-containing protein